MDQARVHRVCGLFLTSLVSEQTTDEKGSEPRERRRRERVDPEFERRARVESYRRPPVTDVEQSFRHSGWWIERLRVQTALVVANVPSSRRERFKDCGCDCVVEWSPQRQRYRTRANYCGDRFCLPCSRARAVRVRERVSQLCGDVVPLLITLTIRNTSQSLTDALDHLLKSFRRLRQQKLWQWHVKGGAAFVEVKKGRGSGLWHPHLHIVADGSYIPAQELSDAWFKATGDSTRVDVQRARDPEDAGRYATKYATKGWTSEITRDLDSCVECVLALRGRRLCTPFGSWHGIELDEPDRGPEDWRRVGRLDHVHAAFVRGEPWAVPVMRALWAEVEEAPIIPPEDGGPEWSSG